jgi:hypothetical protein
MLKERNSTRGDRRFACWQKLRHTTFTPFLGGLRGRTSLRRGRPGSQGESLCCARALPQRPKLIQPKRRLAWLFSGAGGDQRANQGFPPRSHPEPCQTRLPLHPLYHGGDHFKRHAGRWCTRSEPWRSDALSQPNLILVSAAGARPSGQPSVRKSQSEREFSLHSADRCTFRISNCCRVFSVLL